jgi:DNA-directed RNA polymerase specialized sigma24 family protein
MAATTLYRSLAPELPYVRRFARALVGRQDEGDALVRRGLERLVSGEEPAGDTSARLALLRALHRCWFGRTEPVLDGHAVERPSSDTRLQALQPLQREVVLLIRLEGLSVDEVAVVIGCERAIVEKLLENGEAALQSQMRAEILIIEDEPTIAMDLAAIADRMQHRVVGIARTASEAEAMAHELRPHLVLADVRLADGSSGIDAINAIVRDLQVPAIFVTAFPQELLTGEVPEPAFLITKPFVANTVEVTISQALFTYEATRPAEGRVPTAYATGHPE